MIDKLNRIDEKLLFFALVVMLILLDAFTVSPAMTELAKLMLPAYAGYMVGKAKTTEQTQITLAALTAHGK